MFCSFGGMNNIGSKYPIELLEVYRLCLIMEIIEKKEIIKWADNIIMQDDQPDYFLIELSLCGHKNVNEINSLIKEFTGEVKSIIPSRVLLGILYGQDINNQKFILKKVCSIIGWLIWHGQLTDIEKSFVYGLDDEYNLMEMKIKNTFD